MMVKTVRSLPIRALILTSISLALVAMGVMGYWLTQKERDLVATLEETEQPYGLLMDASRLISYITESTNSIRRYRYSRNLDNLNPFFSHTTEIFRMVDTLQIWADERAAEYTFMGKDPERVRKLREAIKDKLAIEFELILAASDTTKRDSFIKRTRLWLKDSPDPSLIELMPDSVPYLADFASVLSLAIPIEDPDSSQVNVTRIKELVDQQAEAWAQQEGLIYKLTQEDVQQTGQVLYWIDLIQYDLRAQIQGRIISARQEKESTSWYIFGLGGFVLLTLLLLVLVIFSELQRRASLQERLRREKARAEKLARAKEEFLANMSHEIRTPMNALIGFSEQLAETSLDPKQRELLVPIQNSAAYLLALLNDILDSSKLESGHLQLEKIGFRPRQVLEEVYATFHQAAEDRGIKLGYEVAPELPAILLGDPLRLKQMLFNLVSNALKFTPQGSVHLRAEVHRMAESTQQVEVSFLVVDTGIGIKKESLDKIFSEFVQADSSTTRKYGGTGLGLSITRKIALLHQGKIELESEPGSGTTARLVLPYPIGSPADLPESAQQEWTPPAALKGKRVLVADDEPYNRLLIRTMLHKWGIRVEEALNGQEVLDRVKQDRFDLILMDMQMPEMDGLTATQHLRKDLALEIPVIALTATQLDPQKEEALPDGLNDWLVKPFPARELLRRLAEVFELELSEEALTPPVPQSSTNGQHGEGLDMDKLYHLANQDPAFLRNLLKLFISSAEKNGTIMVEASAQKDWDQVSMQAHKLIPPSRHLGLQGLVDQLKKLESHARKSPPPKSLPTQVTQVQEGLAAAIAQVQAQLAELA